MTAVGVGVVGLGFMGTRWARALAEHPSCRIRVVSDVREEVGREWARRLDAEYLADPLEAVTRSDLDGVAICTPEEAHVDLALAGLDAGKVLMVEKPLAHTVADSELVRDRARKLDLPLLVGHILRFDPRYAAIRTAIDAGHVGTVQAIRSERIGLVSDQEILGGRTSVALYYGVHEFDIARWYAGDVARVYAERSRGVLSSRGFEVDDLYSVTMRFVGGAHGTSTVGWSLPPDTPGFGMAGFTVFGEEAVVRVIQGETGFLKVTPAGLAHEDVHYSPEVAGRLVGAFGIEVDHYVRCIQGRSEPLCTADDGTEAVRISLAMEASADSGEVMELADN